MSIKFWTLSFRIFHQFTSSIPNESQKTSIFFAKHRLCLTETHPDLPPSLQATFVTWMVDFVSFLDLGFFWDLGRHRGGISSQQTSRSHFHRQLFFCLLGIYNHWVVVSHIFSCSPRTLGKIPILANIFQRG